MAPKIIVNYWVKDAVFKKIGLLRGRVDKHSDFAVFAKVGNTSFGFDVEEGFKSYSPSIEDIKDVMEVIGQIETAFQVPRTSLAKLVSMSVNGRTTKDVKILEKAGWHYEGGCSFNLAGVPTCSKASTVHVLHDLDNPGPQKFSQWSALLDRVWTHKVTGYAVDADGTVVNFRKGKRKGADGKWHPATGGKVGSEDEYEEKA